MEHTGMYCQPLLTYLTQQGLALWLEDAAKIKAYHGLARGKNDKLDAETIAEYAFGKQHKLQLYQPKRAVVEQLQHLLSIRDNLVQTSKQLTTRLKEQKAFISKELRELNEQLLAPVVEKVKQQLQKVEQQIKELLKKDQHLEKLHEFISSVTGIGTIIAANLIVVSNEFKTIGQAKKMACHAGVAPFKHDSGTSIKSKARVSHRANKDLKALLHLGAMAAISAKGEIKEYYQRKVKEGKNKMAVLNAVRNKLIHRVYAVVKKNKKYEKNYTYSLV